MYRKYKDGFYVNAPSKEDFNFPMIVAQYITRYIGRPVMAQSQITNYDGTNVTYWYQRHEDNKILFKTKHTFEFIKKLIIYIPEKGFNMLRYYGLYAMAVKRHVRKIIRIKKRWVFRIELSFHYDLLKCLCGGYMKFDNIYIPNCPAQPPPTLLKYSQYI